MSDKAWNIFEAISYIDGELILSADAALFGAQSVQREGRASKLRRVALIAAVIAALLTVTAVASAWLGMETRYIEPLETETEVRGDFAVYTASEGAYLCLAGTVDSPEYAAQSEWLKWRADYLAEKETDAAWKAEYFTDATPEWIAEYGEDPWNGTAGIYGAYSPEMYDALLDIARRNGVSPHTSRELVGSRGELDERVNTAGFLPAEDGVEYAYIYEDGSFGASMESGASAEYAPSFGVYYMYVGRAGALPDFTYRVKPEEYERRVEWTYTTPDGAELMMTLLPTVLPEGMRTSSLYVEQSELFILYAGEGVFINLHAQVETDGARERAEAFADGFGEWSAPDTSG